MQLKIFSLLKPAILLLFCSLLLGITFPAGAQSTVTLLVHDIKIAPVGGSAAYDIGIVFSLLDSAGNPIKDAIVDNFTLAEDDMTVPVVSVQATDEPINVAIVLDTSGSMMGEKMEAARNAASKFIDKLESSDKVAVVSFSQEISHLIDFTTDHTAAKQQIDLLDYSPLGGTCLHDAAYETIQMAAALPTGRRAVILLTDGVDEAGGQPCSLHTIEDVIDLASQPDRRVPIYTIGLGDSVDGIALERMARQTGGRYSASTGPTQLEALFGRLADELRSQYILHYTSLTTPGRHTLTLHVNYNSNEDEVSREVEMPALPYSLAFTAPASGATIGDETTIMITISGQGVPIAQVTFLANSLVIGTDSSAPYELEWLPTGTAEGLVLLEAIAQDSTGGELARASIIVTYEGQSIITTPGETDGGVIPPKVGTLTVVIIGVVLILLASAAVVIILILVSKKKEREDDQRWKETVQGGGMLDGRAEPAQEEQAMDSFTPGEGALGILVVLESDDPSLKGQHFEINKTITTLGRKSSNDIIFPRDAAVSRQHAVIEERGGVLYLGEVTTIDETGLPKLPTYGTYVNEKKIEAPVALRNGNEIRLGKRVRIRFEYLGTARTNPNSTRE